MIRIYQNEKFLTLLDITRAGWIFLSIISVIYAYISKLKIKNYQSYINSEYKFLTK